MQAAARPCDKQHKASCREKRRGWVFGCLGMAGLLAALLLSTSGCATRGPAKDAHSYESQDGGRVFGRMHSGHTRLGAEPPAAHEEALWRRQATDAPVDSEAIAPEGYAAIAIPDPLPPRVLAEIEAIQKGYPKPFQRGLDRSHKYTPFIFAELDKAGLPRELAWLAMVESQFTPRIVSRAGAGGMWQFMRATGQRYQLRVDHYVDERYNWHNCTRAAINYLKDLYDHFDGDWALALAGYNMGEFGLLRAIESTGGERDFWRLIETPPASERIRLETKRFYPKFLASVIVATNPEKYGFQNNPQSAENTVRMTVRGMYALEDLDQAMGLPSGALAALNPDLLREVTPPTGEYAVAVPAEHRAAFVAALEKTPKMRFAGRTHTVKRGETLSVIARRYGSSVQEITRLNKLTSAERIHVGQVLRLPGGYERGQGGNLLESDREDTVRAAALPAAASGPGSKTYRVKAGDSLFKIAKAQRASVEQIQKWNNMGKRSRIHVGDTLYVSDPGAWTESDSAVAPLPATAQHVVKAGEFPAKIARDHNMSVDELLKANNLSKTSTIHPGQKLTVKPGAGTAPQRGTAPAAPEQERMVYTVVKGDTASGVAAKHGVDTKDVLAWNKLTEKSMLKIGQKLTIMMPVKASGGPMQLASAQQEKLTHVVARGQNPSTIARRYGVKVSDLYKWNGWSNRHVLHVGDEVLIFRD